MKCINCNNVAEWLGKYCQECWEAHCSREWWQKIEKIQGKPDQTIK